MQPFACAPQGHWLTFELTPAAGRPEPVGAKVRVTAGGQVQTVVVRASGSYLSLNDRRPHFGLGSNTRVERVEIVWPDGSQQIVTGVEVDQIVKVRQS